MSERPRLSVIVASYNSAATLERCLESLESQLDTSAQVIVADCSSEDPRNSFRVQFPTVRFLHFEEKLTIPELRREALKVTQGEIVAMTEGRMVPDADWAAALIEAHNGDPKAAAVGGAIDNKAGSSFDAAVYFCEYGRHMPPTGDGETLDLSGGNLSYKRWALEQCKDLVEAGAWEPFLNQRLAEQGHRLLRCERAVVEYRNSLTAGGFLRQRFHYGRWFAAARVEPYVPLVRPVFAAFCPFVPLLLTARLARVVFGRRRRRGAFLLALPWILLFQTVWAAGEFCGYLAGKGASDRQVF